MRKKLQMAAVCCLLAMASVAANAAVAAPAEKYLHVKVDDQANGESVNVNLPLSMAEKILPTLNKGNLHEGRISIHDADINGVDLRAVLDALRTAEDNEFVTVKGKDQNVRVAKSKGNLVVHITDNRDDKKGGQKVEVTVPMKVVDALFSTAKSNELDIVAAIRALSDAGETILVTVQDATQHVRIWVDSKNTSE